jgi:hypothetical protein
MIIAGQEKETTWQGKAKNHHHHYHHATTNRQI